MNAIPELMRLHDGRSGLKAQVAVSRAPGAGDYALEFVASTGALDRWNEILEPDGWRLEAFRKNPVFQNAHRYGDVMNTLGKVVEAEVKPLATGKALCIKVEFAVEANPVAKVAHALYAGGFLSAVSVGFIPLKWEDGGRDKPYRRRYLEQELVEVSAVAVPANREALRLGLKSGALGRASEWLEALMPEDGGRGARDEGSSVRMARELIRAMRVES